MDCSICFKAIESDELLLLSDRYIAHLDCVKCVCCRVSLSSSQSCYLSNNRIFCESHVPRIGQKFCHRCRMPIFHEETVYRFNENLIFHTACFDCSVCGVRLRKGDRFLMDQNGFLQCRNHFPNSKDDHRPTKRTNLTMEQREILRNAFSEDSRPDKSKRHSLSQLTGLNQRTIRIWFQNRRCEVSRRNRFAQRSQD